MTTKTEKDAKCAALMGCEQDGTGAWYRWLDVKPGVRRRIYYPIDMEYLNFTTNNQLAGEVLDWLEARKFDYSLYFWISEETGENEFLMDWLSKDLSDSGHVKADTRNEAIVDARIEIGEV